MNQTIERQEEILDTGNARQLEYEQRLTDQFSSKLENLFQMIDEVKNIDKSEVVLDLNRRYDKLE